MEYSIFALLLVIALAFSVVAYFYRIFLLLFIAATIFVVLGLDTIINNITVTHVFFENNTTVIYTQELLETNYSNGLGIMQMVIGVLFWLMPAFEKRFG